MRNLKRALSLALATVMTMGLMMVGTGASYQDVDDSHNVEAIEVLQAVGIMTGDENGEFNPDANVTRNEMAVIMANLLNLDYDYYRGTNPFTDVPSWAAPYVAACAAEGVTAGAGGNFYNGAGNVTASEASLMVMKTLGYFQYQADFGDDWKVATIRQASYINLFSGINATAETALTRNQIAQLVLNGLKADMVTFTGDVGITVGDVVVGHKTEYSSRTSADKKYNAIIGGKNDIAEQGQYYIQLGEELYDGDLTLKASTDDFARPADTWRYDGKDIGTYTDDADLTYTAKVEAGDIYKDLGLSKTIDKSDVTVYVNGVEDEDLSVTIKKGSDTRVANSANGVLTEVYYDSDNETILVTHIDTYVGTVVRTVEATDSKDAYVVIAPEAPIGAGLTAPIGGNEKFETDEEFADEAYVLYTYSEAVDEIKSVELAEELTGVVTRAENSNTNEQDAKALTIDGTRYTDSYMVAGEKLGDISVDEQYTVYLDSYGYLIYVERIDEIGDYALLYNVDSGTLFDSNKACLIFADGTAKIVNTAKDYSDVDNLNYDFDGDGDVDAADQTAWNTSYPAVGTTPAHKAPVIVTYRADSDNEYTLRAVRGYQGITNINGKNNASACETDMLLVNDKAGITGLPESPVTANSATTFVVRDPETRNYDKIGDWTSYTGIKNAPSIDIRDLDVTATRNPADESTEQADVYYYCKNGKMVTIMFIVPDAEVVVEDGVNKNIYLSSRDISNLIHDTDYSVSYFEFPAVVNGEATTVKVASNANGLTTEAAVKALGGQLYGRYTTNKDGIITSLTNGTAYVDGAESGILNDVVGIDKVSKEYTILVGYNAPATPTADPTYDYTITVDEDADIFYVDEDGDINVSSYNAIAIDEDDLVYAVVDDYMVQTLVVYEVNTKDNAQAATVAITGEKNVTVGDTLTLTANVTLSDTKNDKVIGYQWYRTTAPANYGTVVADIEANADKIAGATSATLTVDTATAGSYYYYCVVETYNDKVPGVDTAKAADMSAQITISNPAAPVMTIRVYYRLNDDTIIFSEILSNQTAETNGYVTVKAEMYKNSALHAYELVGTDTDYVAMVPNGTANVYFTVKAGTPANAVTAVTNTSGEWGTVDGGGNYIATGTWTASGNTVTASYSSSSVGDGTVVMNDTARFLGSLYRNGDANVIVFNGVTYKWDSSEPLKGSNWFNATDDALNDTEGNKNTLVSALVAWQAANPTATSLTLTVDGVNITINYDFT